MARIDALIFDFDGIVVDSEPIHLAGFQRVMKGVGVRLTREDYYGKYLGYDDHDCFRIAAADAGVDLAEPRIAELIAAKTEYVRRAFAESIQPLPGAAELIRAAADAGVLVAVCSGALRGEIDLAARTVGVLDCFRAIVAAEDVRRGKPDPEGYLLALDRLSVAAGRTLDAGCCVVVEDAPAGIDASRAAGMKTLAVTNSYPAGRLAAADRVVDSLMDVALADLDELV